MLRNDQEDPFFFCHVLRDVSPVPDSFKNSLELTLPAVSPETESNSSQITPRNSFTRLATAIELLANYAEVIADSLSSVSPGTVDTVYVAERLGCSTVWIAEQARSGAIPSNCVVPGTGNGRPWKFHRVKIEAWIRSR